MLKKILTSEFKNLIQMHCILNSLIFFKLIDLLCKKFKSLKFKISETFNQKLTNYC